MSAFAMTLTKLFAIALSAAASDVTSAPSTMCSSSLSTCDEFVEIDAMPYLESENQLTVQTHYDDTSGCETDVVSTLRNCWVCEDVPTAVPTPAPTPLPTLQPTPKPTPKPTPAPTTALPSQSPSRSPTTTTWTPTTRPSTTAPTMCEETVVSTKTLECDVEDCPQSFTFSTYAPEAGFQYRAEPRAGCSITAATLTTSVRGDFQRNPTISLSSGIKEDQVLTDASCADSTEWHKKGATVKDCEWVSKYTERCTVVGEDDSLASESCPMACGTCSDYCGLSADDASCTADEQECFAAKDVLSMLDPENLSDEDMVLFTLAVEQEVTIDADCPTAWAYAALEWSYTCPCGGWEPSATPSALPNPAPSVAPTSTPSSLPSPAPTAIPSALPSAAPIPAPSAAPFPAPSAAPGSPTDAPTCAYELPPHTKTTIGTCDASGCSNIFEMYDESTELQSCPGAKLERARDLDEGLEEARREQGEVVEPEVAQARAGWLEAEEALRRAAERVAQTKEEAAEALQARDASRADVERLRAEA